MNEVIVTGNITSIFENAGNTKVTVADNYKDTTTFIPCTFFSENTRQFINKYMVAGDHVAIKGRIGNYKDNFGKETLSIVAHEINFEGYKNPAKTAKKTEKETDNFTLIDNGEFTENDLPWNTEENNTNTDEQTNTNNVDLPL